MRQLEDIEIFCAFHAVSLPKNEHDSRAHPFFTASFRTAQLVPSPENRSFASWVSALTGTAEPQNGPFGTGDKSGSHAGQG
jgi:hypothetical protein